MKTRMILALAASILLCATAQAAAIESNPAERTAFQKLKLSVLPSSETRLASSEFAKPRTRSLQKCVNRAGGNDSVDNLKTMDDAHKQKIHHLCGNGKREIAQEYARDVATEMMRDPRVVELQKCPADVLGSDPYLSTLAKPEGVETNQHVCDKGE